MRNDANAELKLIRFTADYPALYWELLDNNLPHIGASITGFAYVLMGLENLYRLAKKQHNEEILSELKCLGMDGNYFKTKAKRYGRGKPHRGKNG